MKSHSFYALCLFFFALLIRLAFLTATYPDKDRVAYFEDVGIAINLLEGRGYVFNFSMIHECSSKTHGCETTCLSYLGFSCILCFRHEKFLCALRDTCPLGCFYLCAIVPFYSQILALQSGYCRSGFRSISTLCLPFSSDSRIDYFTIIFNLPLLLRISEST